MELRDLKGPSRAKAIVSRTAIECGITADEILSNFGTKNVIEAKRVLYRTLMTEMGWTAHQVASFVGKHHVTILFALGRARTMSREERLRPRKLHLPLGTRLDLITQHPGGIWRIYTGINDKNIPVDRALGTYIELTATGKATMVTKRPDGEEEHVVMETRYNVRKRSRDSPT